MSLTLIVGSLNAVKELFSQTYKLGELSIIGQFYNDRQLCSKVNSHEIKIILHLL